MVYNSNRQYNTRHSVGRYNTPGQFVAAGGPGQQQRQQPSPQQQRTPQRQQQQPPQQQPPQQQPPQPPLPQPQPSPAQQPSFVPPLPPTPPQEPKFAQRTNQAATNEFQEMQESDVDMKTEGTDLNESTDEANRPSWMKIKKINKKERRRRQNRHLRRLITPKNALMVLNEMMLGDQHTSQQFKVEPAETNQYYQDNRTNFCAELTLNGDNYRGYGETKMGARNAAAEQAIRDLIIKRMQKAVTADAANSGGEGEGDMETGEGEETLPMIQLASFALHKLFSEWEYDGHKVPQLRPPPTGGAGSSAGDAESEALAPASRRAARVRAPRVLPANAAGMHPCTLLTYMRPGVDYRELAVDGDSPQNMLFTMGVDLDGATYIGKASNRKAARRLAAKAACAAVFGVQFDDVVTASKPDLNKEP